MIKLEHVVLPSPEQMEFVIEGMRNPMNSWDKSDTCFGDVECYKCTYHPASIKCEMEKYRCQRRLGQNDISLMQKLSIAGTDHRKFMRMMPVMVRITAPLYWWKEFDTYKVGTVANSCSTMHKIQAKEFTLEDFSCEHLMNAGDKDIPTAVVGCGDCFFSPMGILQQTIVILNSARDFYLNTKDKKYWWQMIQLLPSSYNQTRNVILNYEVLKNIYIWRKDHKLDEWREFCEWIESLPNSELITGKE